LTITGSNANCTDIEEKLITVIPVNDVNASYWTNTTTNTHLSQLDLNINTSQTIRFKAEVPDGKTLKAYQFLINFDPDAVNVVAVKSEGSTIFEQQTININSEAGTISVNGFSTSGNPGPETISFVDVTLTGKASGTFDLTTEIEGFGSSGTDNFIPTTEVVSVSVGTTNYHSADYNPQDNAINLSELLRVIQFYNFDKQGGGGAYHCDTRETNAYGYEDGFRPGLGNPDTDHECTPHSSDYEHEIKHPGRSVTKQPQDWIIDLDELLRLIQIYNSKCATQYEVDSTKEDGFKVLDCN
jgi:hypothetical protein